MGFSSRRPLLSALFVLCLVSLLALPGFGAASSPKKAVYKGKTSAGLVITLKTSRDGKRLGYRVHSKATCPDGSAPDIRTQDEGRPGRRAKINRRTGKFKLEYRVYATFEDTVVIQIRGQVTRRGARGTFRRHVLRVPYPNGNPDRPDTVCDTGALTWKVKRTR